MSYPQTHEAGTFAHMDPKNIPWRGEISIQQVMSILRDDASKSFWIAFVRAGGKQAGSVKVLSSARYGAPLDGHAREVGTRLVKTPRAKALHTEKGTLPMTDTTNGEYKTPLISHIIGFNMYRVKH
jgi:hypothetical protein